MKFVKHMSYIHPVEQWKWKGKQHRPKFTFSLSKGTGDWGGSQAEVDYNVVQEYNCILSMSVCNDDKNMIKETSKNVQRWKTISIIFQKYNLTLLFPFNITCWSVAFLWIVNLNHQFLSYFNLFLERAVKNCFSLKEILKSPIPPSLLGKGSETLLPG